MRYILPLLLIIFTVPANAAVYKYSVEKQVAKDKSKVIADTPECSNSSGCECTVHNEYPAFTANEKKLENINQKFASIGAHKCNEAIGLGEHVINYRSTYKVNDLASNYHVKMVAIRSTLNLGGATDNSANDYYLVDLEKDKFITPDEVFGANIQQVREYISNKLKSNDNTDCANPSVGCDTQKKQFLNYAAKNNNINLSGQYGYGSLNLSGGKPKVEFPAGELGASGAGPVSVAIPVKFIDSQLIKDVITSMSKK